MAEAPEILLPQTYQAIVTFPSYARTEVFTTACLVSYDSYPYSQIFHFSTAEQHCDEITFCAVCLGTKFDMSFVGDMWLGNTDVAPGRMHKFTLDLGKRTCEGHLSDCASVEFPTVHPYRHGLVGGRYSYLMASDREGQNLPYRDVVKVRGSNTHRPLGMVCVRACHVLLN